MEAQKTQRILLSLDQVFEVALTWQNLFFQANWLQYLFVMIVGCEINFKKKFYFYFLIILFNL